MTTIMATAEEGSELRSIENFSDHGNFVTFLEKYLLPNQPCVFGESFTRDWRARREWRKDDDTPNLLYLQEKFGNAVVPVADCARQEYSAHPKTKMTLKEYIQYWRSKVIGSGDNTAGLKYLEDWHFVKDFPNYEAYTVPDYFRSDWLNETWSTRLDITDDYRFVYMGPKGTWTPFHADVFRSYSWSANVCGCKEWLFYPPGEEKHLRDKFGHLPFDVTSTDLNDKEKYPNFYKSTGPIRVTQRSGEIIFVPSGWHHQVRNVEDTISINHNWTNSCGIGYTWTHLQSELTLVERELEDCRLMEGWEEQCQVVLRASAGMSYWEFVQLLSLIAMSRLNQLREILTPDSKLCAFFDPLQTLVKNTLSKSFQSVTFLHSASEFESVVTGANMDAVFTESDSEVVLKQVEKLATLLSRALWEVFCSEQERVTRSGKTQLVLFVLYELSTAHSLLLDTVSRIENV